MPNRRPQLTLMGHSATPEEAAAVIAAVEQFMRDTAPTVADAPEPVSGWLRAARHEAVERDPGALELRLLGHGFARRA